MTFRVANSMIAFFVWPTSMLAPQALREAIRQQESAQDNQLFQ